MNKLGISIFSIIPMRTKSSEKSEMCTQLLFGETYEVIEEQKKWLLITSIFDNYTGWIDKKMHFPISLGILKKLNKIKPYINQEVIQVYENQDFIYPIHILPGSSFYLDNTNKRIEFSSKKFYLKSGSSNNTNNNLIETAKSYLNAPYLWGGRTPFGIDCSGFIQIVYKINGFSLPRDASRQVEIGKTVEFMEDTKAGDLAFFDDDEGRIIHVGIILENNEIIHASGKVRIDRLDHQGIFNKETNNYSHKLRIIKRII